MTKNKIAETLRNKMFWTLDRLRGGLIHKDVSDIKEILEKFGSSESQNRRDQLLSSLLEHATTNVNFYKKFKGATKITDFPVVNKRTYQAGFDEFQSQVHLNQKTVTQHTSGSSGAPFKSKKDKRKIRRNQADTIYFNHKAGLDIGDRLYYVRRWFEMHSKSRLVSWAQNIKKIEVAEFSEGYLSKFMSTLESDQSNKAIMSYASALVQTSRFLENKNYEYNPTIKCIISIGEGIRNQTIEKLEKQLKTKVLSRYSNLENGILSFQMPNTDRLFQINWASYFIEILHLERDEPVPYGELGRVVVTDLFNYAMPFIRYDTGDLAIMSVDHKFFNGAPAFSRVDGRRMDVLYNTSGLPISSFIVFHLEEYEGIRQFQLIQEGEKEYVFKLNTIENFNNESEIHNLFIKYFGEGAQIRFEYVDNIPLLSSGKRRITVNNVEKYKTN